MRVAVDTSTEVGNRSVRSLLSESRVAFVGVLNAEVPRHKRSGPIDDLATFDVLMSDGATDFHRLVGLASVAEIPLVLWHELDAPLQESAPIPIVHGANVAIALTGALASHPNAAITDDDTVVVGWTEPGKPHRSGHPLPFPEPIGSVWGKKRSEGRYAAFLDNDLGGAVVDVEGPTGRRIVGVSDHAAYIEALTLAGTAITVAETQHGAGAVSAGTLGEQLLNTVSAMELDVAVWRSNN